MKICYICPEYPEGPHGGIGTFTQRIARELSKRGHQVRVIGVYKETYNAPDYEEDGNIKVWRLRERKGKFGWVISWFKQYQIIKRWIKENEIDLIEAPDSRGWYAFWGKLSIPLILRFHGSQTYIATILNKKPNRLTKFLEGLSYSRANALVSVSNFNAITTEKIFKIKKQIHVIYNGVEINNIKRNRNVISTIVFANTLSEFKGILDFLNAIELLTFENINFDVRIFGKDALIGKIPASEYIKVIANKPSLKGKVSYYGNKSLPTLLEEYKNAAVAVFPSYVESFGLGPIEAMMCGCPVIFTNNTTGPELIEDKVDGLLIPPNNPKEIKNAILYILNNHSFSNIISKNGRLKVINTFNIQTLTEKNLTFYNSCLNDFHHKTLNLK
jgi:glycosyltransferase involved in cell wall biosynthesis